MKLYHMTSDSNVPLILERGLKGGHGQNGMGQEYTSLPTLYLTKSPAQGDRYGNRCIIVDITPDFIKKLSNHKWFGDTLIIKGDGILIPPEYLSEGWEDYANGVCEVSKFCTHFCPDYKKCEEFQK